MLLRLGTPIVSSPQWCATAALFPTPRFVTLCLSLKAAMVEVFTPQELESTINQGGVF